ncbi:uncharacterized protein [Asterias amurensis]|uniref:uncharacterized protein n=1 Tax=Asterias amurensis TaxID=7602 RepID=UPI003AB24843
MGRGCWLIHLLLMCSLDTTLVAVNAQIVAITKVSPVGDPVEGNVVELQCQASGLMVGYIIEWTRMEDSQEVAIARNGMSLDSRYTLSILVSGAQSKFEILAFTATKEDTAVVYGCRVRNSVGLNSTVVVQARPLSFSVLYFPSATYPFCFPNGPYTVQEGTIVNMSCTTGIGNPQVQMQIVTSSVTYSWTYDRDTKEQMRSLQLSVTGANDGGSYQCKISPDSTGSTPFTGMNRSCTIGPITVSQMTSPQHPMTSLEPTSTDSHRTITVQPSRKPTTDQANFDMSYCQLCQTYPTTTNTSNVVGTPWLVAFLTSLILFIVSLIINIFLLIKHRHLKITKEKETNVAKADPYMELQPTEDKNKVYMEPTTATTTTQDTYYQPVEVETDSHKYDYARPEGSTSTAYEVVSKPPSSAESPYQNIKS